MHLRCVFPSVNSVLTLLIISLVSKTHTKEKEYLPEFDNFSIIDTDRDKSDRNDDQEEATDWIRQSGHTHNMAYNKIPPKFSSADEAVDHVISSGVIESLETEELERISKKYNSDVNENRDVDNHHRNRWSDSSKLLHQLLEIYKLKSSGILAKRGEGPQLSIVNPLDVLRQRLLLELARRRMKENQDQIQANAEILKKIGKRSISSKEIIPQLSVRHSSGDLISTINTNNSLIADSTSTSTTTTKFKSFNKSINKSLNKCQKCRRKKTSQQIIFGQ